MSSRRPPSDEAIDIALTRPRPLSLSADEVGENITRAPVATVPVSAWVRFPETPIRVRGEAVAWTQSAVLVEFTMHDGRTFQTWVWKGAVSRR